MLNIDRMIADKNYFANSYMNHIYGSLWFLNPITHLIKYYQMLYNTDFYTRCGISAASILGSKSIGRSSLKSIDNIITQPINRIYLLEIAANDDANMSLFDHALIICQTATNFTIYQSYILNYDLANNPNKRRYDYIEFQKMIDDIFRMRNINTINDEVVNIYEMLTGINVSYYQNTIVKWDIALYTSSDKFDSHRFTLNCCNFFIFVGLGYFAYELRQIISK